MLTDVYDIKVAVFLICRKTNKKFMRSVNSVKQTFIETNRHSFGPGVGSGSTFM